MRPVGRGGMDRNTIFAKTGKGMREAAGTTRSLPREMHSLLNEIDGKSSLEHLLGRLADRPLAELEELLERLAAEGFIRVRPHRAGNPLAPATASEGSVDLDFTSPQARATLLAEQVRREAEAEAKRKAEETARRWAEVREARRAAERATREAEKRARQEAEQRAKAEQQARRLAEEKARREAAEKARRQAAERARLAAVEKERRHAEETKARHEAEERARLAAAEQARREADERARREADERARLAAEELTRREAEERAAREAADRARRAAEEKARRETDERAQREAEERARLAAAEQVRRAAEERAEREAAELARRQAEETAAREAAERVVLETAAERLRRQAERDAALLAEQQAAERIRREAEQRAERAARQRARRDEDALRAQATAAERARLSAEKRARREARRNAPRQAAPPAREAAAPRRAFRRPRKWGRPLAWGMASLLALFLIGLHVLPFNGRIPSLEQTAGAQLGQAVTIESLHLALVPRPHWRLDGVVIGADKRLQLPRVRMIAELATLLDDSPSFTAVELDAPRMTAAGLAWLLFAKPGAPGIAFAQVDARHVVLDAGKLSLPSFDISAAVGGDGRWRKIVATSTDRTLRLELRPTGATVQVVADAVSLALPFAAAPRLTDVHATASAGPDALDLTAFEGQLLGGSVRGSARLAWGAAMQLAGELRATRIEATQLYPELFEDGRLDLTATFALPIPPAEPAAMQLAGQFAIQRGTLRGIDLGSVLKDIGTGGRTRFARLSGSLVADAGGTQLRALHLDAGAMAATGFADIAADARIRGQVTVVLGLAGRRHQASLGLAGAFSPPYGRNLRWMRR